MTGQRTPFTILLFLAGNLLLAQVSAPNPNIDFVKIVSSSTSTVPVQRYSAKFYECANEFQFILTGLFVGYKKFVSSQDERSCTFVPSCSSYALETIGKKGAFIGFLDAIDRLTRCNGLTPENYEIDEHQKLLIDNP